MTGLQPSHWRLLSSPVHHKMCKVVSDLECKFNTRVGARAEVLYLGGLVWENSCTISCYPLSTSFNSVILGQWIFQKKSIVLVIVMEGHLLTLADTVSFGFLKVNNQSCFISVSSFVVPSRSFGTIHPLTNAIYKLDVFVRSQSLKFDGFTECMMFQEWNGNRYLGDISWCF